MEDTFFNSLSLRKNCTSDSAASTLQKSKRSIIKIPDSSRSETRPKRHKCGFNEEVTPTPNVENISKARSFTKCQNTDVKLSKGKNSTSDLGVKGLRKSVRIEDKKSEISAQSRRRRCKIDLNIEATPTPKIKLNTKKVIILKKSERKSQVNLLEDKNCSKKVTSKHATKRLTIQQSKDSVKTLDTNRIKSSKKMTETKNLTPRSRSKTNSTTKDPERERQEVSTPKKYPTRSSHNAVTNSPRKKTATSIPSQIHTKRTSKTNPGNANIKPSVGNEIINSSTNDSISASLVSSSTNVDNINNCKMTSSYGPKESSFSNNLQCRKASDTNIDNTMTDDDEPLASVPAQIKVESLKQDVIMHAVLKGKDYLSNSSDCNSDIEFENKSHDSIKSQLKIDSISTIGHTEDRKNCVHGPKNFYMKSLKKDELSNSSEEIMEFGKLPPVESINSKDIHTVNNHMKSIIKNNILYHDINIKTLTDNCSSSSMNKIINDQPHSSKVLVPVEKFEATDSSYGANDIEIEREVLEPPSCDIRRSGECNSLRKFDIDNREDNKKLITKQTKDAFKNLDLMPKTEESNQSNKIESSKKKTEVEKLTVNGNVKTGSTTKDGISHKREKQKDTFVLKKYTRRPTISKSTKRSQIYKPRPPHILLDVGTENEYSSTKDSISASLVSSSTNDDNLNNYNMPMSIDKSSFSSNLLCHNVSGIGSKDNINLNLSVNDKITCDTDIDSTKTDYDLLFALVNEDIKVKSNEDDLNKCQFLNEKNDLSKSKENILDTNVQPVYNSGIWLFADTELQNESREDTNLNDHSLISLDKNSVNNDDLSIAVSYSFEENEESCRLSPVGNINEKEICAVNKHMNVIVKNINRQPHCIKDIVSKSKATNDGNENKNDEVRSLKKNKIVKNVAVEKNVFMDFSMRSKPSSSILVGLPKHKCNRKQLQGNLGKKHETSKGIVNVTSNDIMEDSKHKNVEINSVKFESFRSTTTKGKNMDFNKHQSKLVTTSVQKKSERKTLDLTSNSNERIDGIIDFTNDESHMTNRSLSNVIETESVSNCKMFLSAKNNRNTKCTGIVNAENYSKINPLSDLESSSSINSSENSHNSSKLLDLTSDSDKGIDTIINPIIDKSPVINQSLSGEERKGSVSKCKIAENNKHAKCTDVISENDYKINRPSINDPQGSLVLLSSEDSHDSAPKLDLASDSTHNLSIEKSHLINRSLSNVIKTEPVSKCEMYLSAKNNRNKKYAGVIAEHDLKRNPLSDLVSSSSSINSSENSHNSSKLLDHTSDCGKRIDTIINPIIDKSPLMNQSLSSEERKESVSKCKISENNEHAKCTGIIVEDDSNPNSLLIYDDDSSNDDFFTEGNYKSSEFMEDVMGDVFSFSATVSANDKSVELLDNIKPDVAKKDTEFEKNIQNAEILLINNSNCISETQNELPYENELKVNKTNDFLENIGSELELQILQEKLLSEFLVNDSGCSEMENLVNLEIDLSDKRPSSSGVEDEVKNSTLSEDNILSAYKEISYNSENKYIPDGDTSTDSDSWEDFKRRRLHKRSRNQINELNKHSCDILSDELKQLKNGNKDIDLQKIKSKKFQLSKFVLRKPFKKENKNLDSSVNYLHSETKISSNSQESVSKAEEILLTDSHVSPGPSSIKPITEISVPDGFANERKSVLPSLTKDLKTFKMDKNLQSKLDEASVKILSGGNRILKSFISNNKTLHSDLDDIGFANIRDNAIQVSVKDKNTLENNEPNSSSNMFEKKKIKIISKTKEPPVVNDEITSIENFSDNIVGSTHADSKIEVMYDNRSKMNVKVTEDPIVENSNIKDDFNSTSCGDIPYTDSSLDIKDTESTNNIDFTPNVLDLKSSKQIDLSSQANTLGAIPELQKNYDVDSSSKNIKPDCKERKEHKKFIRKHPSKHKYLRLKEYRQKYSLLQSNVVDNNDLNRNIDKKFHCENNNNNGTFSMKEITHNVILKPVDMDFSKSLGLKETIDNKILKPVDMDFSSRVGVKETIKMNTNEVEFVGSNLTELTNSDFKVNEGHSEGKSLPDKTSPSNTAILDNEKNVPSISGICPNKQKVDEKIINNEQEENCSVVSSSSITKLSKNTNNSSGGNTRDGAGLNVRVARSSLTRKKPTTTCHLGELTTANKKQAPMSLQALSTNKESSKEFNLKLNFNGNARKCENIKTPEEIVSEGEGYLDECLEPYCITKILTNKCLNRNCNKQHEMKIGFCEALPKERIELLLRKVVKKSTRISASFMKEVLRFFGLHAAKIPILSLSGRFLSKEFLTSPRPSRSYFKEVSTYFFLALTACGLKRSKVIIELINYNMKCFSSCQPETILYILEEWEISSSSVYPVWPIVEPLILKGGLVLTDNILLKLFKEVMEAKDLNCLKCYANQLFLLSNKRFQSFNKDYLKVFIQKLHKVSLISIAESLSNRIPGYFNEALPSEQPQRENTTMLRRTKSSTDIRSSYRNSDAPSEELMQVAENAVQIAVKSGNYRQLVSTIATYSEKKIELSILKFVFNCFNEEEPLMMTELLMKEFSQVPGGYFKYRSFCSSLICSFVVYFSKTCLWEVSYGFINLFDKFQLDKFNVKDAIGDLSLMRIILVYSEVYFHNRCYKESVDIILSKKDVCNFTSQDVACVEDSIAAQVLLKSYLCEYMNSMKVDLAANIFELILGYQRCCFPIDLSQYFEVLLILIFNENRIDDRPLIFYSHLYLENDIPLYGLSVRILVNMAYKLKKWTLVTPLFRKGLLYGCYPSIELEMYRIILVRSFTEEEMYLYISEWCLHFKKRLHQGRRIAPKTLLKKDGKQNVVIPTISICFKEETLSEFQDSSNLIIPSLLSEVDESPQGCLQRLKFVLQNLNLVLTRIENEVLIIDTISFFNLLKKV